MKVKSKSSNKLIVDSFIPTPLYLINNSLVYSYASFCFSLNLTELDEITLNGLKCMTLNPENPQNST